MQSKPSSYLYLPARLVSWVVILSVCSLAWGQEVQEVSIPSTADGHQQKAMWFAPYRPEPVPLLVVLHTWSGNYQQDAHQACLDWAQKRGWAYIHPDFRGPNNRPESTGSDRVVQDILDAVAFAREKVAVDPRRIYLIGTSGGGYTALLMAGRHPQLWAGVSAWVPITDLYAWYIETRASGRKYWKDLEAACGGAPGDSREVDAEYRRRSPLTYLRKADGVALDINAGIHDGHTGSVPVSHSLYAFNEVARKKDRIDPEDILYMVQQEDIPPALKGSLRDETYGDKTPLFRKTSGKARVTLFEGGHEYIPLAALLWLEVQRK